MGVRYFGAAVPRIEDPELVSGRGRYLDDIDLPGMTHAAFVRSAQAHARIKDIDASAAVAVPGVVAVLTAADLGVAGRATPQFAPSPLIAQNRTQHVLASQAVHYVGDAIAIVVAATRAIAEDAASLVVVDYEPLARSPISPPRSIPRRRRHTRARPTTAPRRCARSSAISTPFLPGPRMSFASTSPSTAAAAIRWNAAA